MIFGQRSQLYWELPVTDTMDIYRVLYDIPTPAYERNREMLVDLLQMQEVLATPVRQLSLGQKMRANLAAAFLHNPEIVFLDKPTIGLDVIAKDRIREFIKQMNREHRTTFIPTTHDMDDIDLLCWRLIMIDRGSLVFDGELAAFKREFGSECEIVVEFRDDDPTFTHPEMTVVSTDGRRREYRIDRQRLTVAEAVRAVTHSNDIVDIEIRTPQVEDIVRRLYEGSAGITRPEVGAGS